MGNGATLGWVADVEVSLAAGVAGLDPDAVWASEAPAVWEALDRIERLAASAKTLLARRVEDSDVWRRRGHKSPVDFLAARAGTTAGRARGDLETSKRLAGQPVLAEACRRGELSPVQADAVSAAAAVDPAAEGRLVAKAKGSTVADLRDECARTRAAADADPDATHRRIHRGRSLRRFTGPDGAWNLMARGTPEAGARFNAALDPIIEELFRVARTEGRRESHDAFDFDALIAMADRARGATTPEAAETGPDGEPAADVAGAAGEGAGGKDHVGRRVGNPTHLALLRIDLEALRRGAVEGEERCEITGLGPIPVKVARALLGDAILKLVITRGVDVVHVTHLGRGPTAAQRVALLWSSPRCQVQDCHATRVEVDHRIPWAETGHTRLDELDPLCPHHHALKTRADWALTPGTGRRPLVPPDDPRHPNQTAHAPPEQAYADGESSDFRRRPVDRRITAASAIPRTTAQRC